MPLARRVWASAAGIHACGIALVLLSAAFVLDLPPSRLPSLYALAPPAAAVLGLAWYLALRHGLAPALTGTGAPARAAAVRWPYRAAAAAVVAWAVGEVCLAATGALAWGLPLYSWFSLVACAFAISFGVALYQWVWHRRLLAPRVEALAGSGEPDTVRTRVPLRLRLTLALTGLVFFACAFALVTAYSRNRVLVGHLLQTQAGALLRQQLEAERLGHAIPGVDGVELVRLAPGEPVPTALGTLPATDEGTLPEATDRRVGVFHRHPDGSLTAILLPNPPQAARDLRVLVLIMTLVFVLAAGIVQLTSEDLSRPVMGLAERAKEMAEGDLDRPVPVTEADEVGVLEAAFEHLRAALRDKIAAVEALNAGLEEEVHRRTAELEDALAALKRSQSQLVQSEKMASLGQVVAGVAHEINNPVNALVNVLGPLEELAGAIEDSEVAQDFADMLRVLRSGAERTRRIVSDLRTFSRLDESELKSVDLRECVDATLHLMGGAVPDGVQVHVAHEDLPPLPCYDGELNQVFLNLLNNAVQALRGSGNVWVRTLLEGDEAVFEVRDDGPGISPAALPRIFDPFFTTKDVGEGTGLGLSISHGIVERHGGRIEVCSTPGEGTTFSVRLPAAGPPVSG